MPGTGTCVVAGILIGFGIVTVLAGVCLIIVAALTAFYVYRQNPKNLVADSGVDWAKILEALSKLPQWMLAIIAGNAQILIGYWLLGATLFGYKLWP
jgi:multisubunit Na+/H+ antiporter MnhB subunit